MSAMLLVNRLDEERVRYLLRVPGERGGIVAVADAQLNRGTEQRIGGMFEEFAECHRGVPRDEDELRRAGQLLYRLVVPEGLRSQLAGLEGPLTILTDVPKVPWEILHDEREFLSLRLPASRQLMVRERFGDYLAYPIDTDSLPNALIISDPTGELHGAAQEGAALHDSFRARGRSLHLTGPHATWNAVQRALLDAEYSVIHYCGHLDHDAATGASSLRLADARLLADEAMKVFRGAPIVFLNACYSDTPAVRSDVAWARSESFAEAFMLGNQEGAATAVVATMWRVPDEPEEAGARFAGLFYEELFRGASLSEALLAARRDARGRGWGPMVWGPYVLYGDATLMPFVPRPAGTDAPVVATDAEMARSGDGASSRGESSGPSDVVEEAERLGTRAREALLVALREMKRSGHRTLTSLHVLIGLDEVGGTALDEVRRQKGIADHWIRDRFREIVADMPPAPAPSSDGSSGYGVSKSALRAFATAAHRSAHDSTSNVGADDLLAGILAQSNSSAVRLLQHWGLAPFALRARLVHQPAGQWTDWRFDAVARGAMEAGADDAVEYGLDFFGTPHFVIGLIQSKAPLTIGALRKMGGDPRILVSALRACLGSARSVDGVTVSGRLGLTDRASSVLDRAAAASRGSPISERDLLQALLRTRSGATARVMKLCRVDPSDMWSAIRRLEAGSDGPFGEGT